VGADVEETCINFVFHKKAMRAKTGIFFNARLKLEEYKT